MGGSRCMMEACESSLNCLSFPEIVWTSLEIKAGEGRDIRGWRRGPR